MKIINLYIVLILLLVAPLDHSMAATYNFNFYNNEKIVTPSPSPSPEKTNSVNTAAPEVQAAEPKIYRFRVTLSGIMDTYKKVEDNERKDELAYANRNDGYRLGFSFGRQVSFIITPYVQYTTFKFETPTQFLQHCYSSCYTEPYRTSHVAKIPAGGLALEKEWELGTAIVTGSGAGVSYGVEDGKDPHNGEKNKVKQKSYYVTAKLGLIMRPEIILNIRGEYGETLTEANVFSEGNQIQFKIKNNYLRSGLELSYLF